MSVWHLYLIRSSGGSLYTGITTDVERRFSEHCADGPRCARSLRGKGPLELVYATEVGSQTRALRLERKVKAMSRAQKEALIRSERELPGVPDDDE